MSGMKRREFITLLGGGRLRAARWAPLPQSRMLRVGFVGIQPREFRLYAAFPRADGRTGYQEGRNFAFEFIQARECRRLRDKLSRARDATARCVSCGRKRASARAALSAAGGGAPIVFLAIDFDPLTKGYVASLSRPGGNMTGIFVRQLELAAKRVEIAREVFPRAKVVWIAFDTISREQGDASARPLASSASSRV